MKILQSSFFRAICAIAVGILLIKYPDNTVTWITVAIGVLFFLSGIISLVVYINARKHVSEYKITDAEGNVLTGEPPTFPIVGVGSIILGAILALTPNIFITALMYIIGGMLILGAINQYMNLVNARKFGKISFGYWIFPSVILLTGLYVIIRPILPRHRRSNRPRKSRKQKRCRWLRRYKMMRRLATPSLKITRPTSPNLLLRTNPLYPSFPHVPLRRIPEYRYAGCRYPVCSHVPRG